MDKRHAHYIDNHSQRIQAIEDALENVATSNAPRIEITNPLMPIPCDITGTVTSFSGSGTGLNVFINNVQIPEGTGNGTFSVSVSNTNITSGAATGAGTTAYAFPDITALSADTGSRVFTVTAIDIAGVSTVLTGTQSFTKLRSGNSGSRSLTVACFMWSNAGAGTYAQAFTYTWATGAVDFYPAGWTASAGVSPGTGYTLYMLQLVLTDSTGSAATTSANWSSATTNNIGYRQDGSIGPTGSTGSPGSPGSNGQSARMAYVVSTSASAPALLSSTTTGSASLPASTGLTWSASATSTLTAGQFMYQVDGLYNPTTNIITWGNAYLSNLKVGSLSAISADLGIVQISSTGSLASTGKAYGGATAGFFLGYSGGQYVLDIGTPTQGITWNGSALSVNGAVINTGNVVGSAITETTMGALAASAGAMVVAYNLLGTITLAIPAACRMVVQVQAKFYNPSTTAAVRIRPILTWSATTGGTSAATGDSHSPIISLNFAAASANLTNVTYPVGAETSSTTAGGNGEINWMFQDVTSAAGTLTLTFHCFAQAAGPIFKGASASIIFLKR